MEAAKIQDASEWVDPRILRTRRMLQESLERLLASKPFEKISVGEIAEDATVNRATFYDHYPDKFALLEGLVSSRFQELLDKRSVVFDGQCSGALLGMTLAMCDYMAAMPGIEKHVESALMTVVRGMILEGLRRHGPQREIAPELLAAAISGAIYGGVNEWVRMPDRCGAEEVGQAIFGLIAPMLHPA
jgi:AcrR family transcriptional regulator